VEARSKARETLERWAANTLPVPRTGLADALDLAAGDPLAAPALADALRKLRREWDLPEDWPDLRLPDLIAALAAEEAARAGEGRVPCTPGDPARPREARALALLARAAVRPAADQDDCLDAALRLLDGAWNPKDARLVPLLKHTAEKQKERAPAKAEAALRRAIAIAEAAPEPDRAELLELRTLLGLHLLQAGRQEEGAGVLQEAFDKGAAGFQATKRELDVAGTLVFALLQAAEEDLRYDRALDLAQRCAGVLEPLKEVPGDARRDLEKLLKRLERLARLQALLGSAWPG
jgi:hypothetical protein